MISSGTGIAPFLGMLQHNGRKVETHLYWGTKTQQSFDLYEEQLKQILAADQLQSFHRAYSREAGQKNYVQDEITSDARLVADTLQNKGAIMICGSIAMQKGVTETLQNICRELNDKPLSYYQNRGQLKMDCY
jgi:sulfite reductase (NADPH) flavoprotein alpha-component